jgi:hypothetical protein
MRKAARERRSPQTHAHEAEVYVTDIKVGDARAGLEDVTPTIPTH